MTRFVLSLLFMLFIVAGAVVVEGGNPLACIGVTSFTVVLMVTLGAAAGVWGLSGISDAWRDAFSETPSCPDRSYRVFNFMEKIFYAGGGICTLMGVVMVLSQLDKIEQIGRGAAMSITGLIYGIFFGVIARMLKERVINK